MFKEKKHCLYSFIGTTILVLVLYIFNSYICVGECYVYIEDVYLGPLFIGTLWLSVILLLLLFFSENIFILWLKYIAWWYILGTIYFVLTVNPYTSEVLSVDRQTTTMFCMGVFFIITFIYALIMNKRLKAKMTP